MSEIEARHTHEEVRAHTREADQVHIRAVAEKAPAVLRHTTKVLTAEVRATAVIQAVLRARRLLMTEVPAAATQAEARRVRPAAVAEAP